MISIICSQGHGEVVGFFFPLIQCLSVSQEDAYKDEHLHFELVAPLFAFHFVKNRLSLQNMGKNCIKKQEVPSGFSPKHLRAARYQGSDLFYPFKAFPNTVCPI